MGSSRPSTHAPTDPGRRIHTIDVLRGFALLGILLVNMELFSHPVQTVVLPVEYFAWADRAAAWLVRFVAEGKFYSLFSLLFGLGFALQMARADEKRVRFLPIYARRLILLLAIGLIHAYLVWVGDILTLYALLGFLLVLFRKSRPRKLLFWAVLFMLLPALFLAFSDAMIALGSAQPGVGEQIQQGFQEQRQGYLADIEGAYAVYGQGDFAQITAQRAHDMGFMAYSSPFLGPSVFAMFLLGLWFARKGVFQNVEEHLPFMRRLLVGGLMVGVVGNAIYASLLGPDSPRFIPNPTVSLATLGQAVGAPALCLFYVSALTLLNRQPVWQRYLAPLAGAGRMALTNYLGQSVICTLIFYGYGLGLFGQVGKAAGLLLAIAIFALQVWFSGWWLSRFRYGPMEWLWRSLTYLRWQPLRASAASWDRR